jgi:alkaline phosphatase
MILVISCTTGNIKGIPTGNVIFIHPDGASVSHWGAMRLIEKGPDGMTNWDKMNAMGIYRSHITNSANASSNAGATVHAFGVKVGYSYYGIHPDKPFKSLSGKDYSIMIEAKNAGMSTALINTGHICEPGTGVFAANSRSRILTDTITVQILNSDIDILFSGGEQLLLPEGVTGFHGKPGIRQDSLNLIEMAKTLGYQVIYNRDQLLALPGTTDKVLGIFAAEHTFNAASEEELSEKGLPLYNKNAPSVDEMLTKSLEIFENKNKQFFMVIEVEGSDNFSNANNAEGAIAALGRADKAIGTCMEFIEKKPGTMLIVASDSNAGGLQVKNVKKSRMNSPLDAIDSNGAPIDGRKGLSTPPFIARPDKFGNTSCFSIVWASYSDVPFGIVARAHGLNADLMTNNVDNTDIYRLMYATLFGTYLE